ncbi:MAG: phosphate/phosphite/phosphonate ABC transporter substrate-binding protein [Bacteroidota bacterium]
MKFKYIAILILLVFCISCTNTKNEKIDVDFADTAIKGRTINDDGTKAVYIAIASMTSPKETYIYYSELINYISQKVGYPIYIKQKKTYEEVNELLENSEVDFAFICSGAFVGEYRKGNIKLLVAPEIDSTNHYHAYIIAQKDSEIEKFADLKNKSFAFTDPLSNTGRFYPLKQLIKLNEDEEDFFEKTVYTYGHDISIQMVNRGIIDGASVHGLIFEYLALYHPERVENIKIVEKSEEFGIPPVVMPATLSQKRREKYRDIFLDIHNDSVGKQILDKLLIDKFVIVDDNIYNSVFQLKKLIGNAESKKNN